MLQLNRTSVVWKTNKQSVIALSSSEAELIAASGATKLLLWVRYLLKELGGEQKYPTVLFQDNQGAISWAVNDIRRAKHVAIRGNFVKHEIENGSIETKYCATTDMLADIFTKAIGRQMFEKHRVALGVLPKPSDM